MTVGPGVATNCHSVCLDLLRQDIGGRTAGPVWITGIYAYILCGNTLARLTGMDSKHIASLALEAWQASGARTSERLADLVTLYTESYHGPRATWNESTRDLCAAGKTAALSSQVAARVLSPR